MELLFHTSAPKVLLALFKKKRLTTNELIDASEAGGSWYSSRISDRLKEMGLIITEEVRDGRKLTIFHELTPKGEEVAQRLTYLFDEKIKLIPISKQIYKTLKETIELYEAQFISVEAFVNELIKKYLLSIK